MVKNQASNIKKIQNSIRDFQHDFPELLPAVDVSQGGFGVAQLEHFIHNGYDSLFFHEANHRFKLRFRTHRGTMNVQLFEENLGRYDIGDIPLSLIHI